MNTEGADQSMEDGVARREFLLSLPVGIAAARGRIGRGGLASGQQDTLLPVSVSTLNHMSFGCDDLTRTVAWYQKVLGMAMHAFQDYAGGQRVLRIGDGPEYVALSQKSEERIGLPPSRLPHFCWGVEDFNVDRLLRALAAAGVPSARSVLREGKTINGVNFEDPNGFPLQFNPVSACGGGGILGDICDDSAVARRRPDDPPPVNVRTLNHVTILVPDVDTTVRWFSRLTDMKRQASERAQAARLTGGRFGAVDASLRVGSGPQFIGLVEGTGSDAFFPHIGFGVQGFDPALVMETLDAHGVTAQVMTVGPHTPAIVLDGPDDVEIQLQDVSYCGGNGPLGGICEPD